MQTLVTTSDTTDLSYWLNWTVLLCTVWVITPVVVAVQLIKKYEDFGNLGSDRRSEDQRAAEVLYVEDVWRPCIKQIHPAWLAALRISAFCFFMTTMVFRGCVRGIRIYLYYTQWTYTLVTFYFGFGSLLSVYGVYHNYTRGRRGSNAHSVVNDVEEGNYVSAKHEETTSLLEPTELSSHEEVSKAARVSSYLFRVIYQTSAGAVVVTDSIYWIVIFPFLAIQDYSFNYMTVNMHTSNIIFLLADTALNRLDFPYFRMAYFFLFTSAYVIFQWLIHACVSIWWPYPFLDLSSRYAPLWYLLAAMAHFPCYGIYKLIIQTKYHLLSKWCGEDRAAGIRAG